MAATFGRALSSFDATMPGRLRRRRTQAERERGACISGSILAS